MQLLLKKKQFIIAEEYEIEVHVEEVYKYSDSFLSFGV